MRVRDWVQRTRAGVSDICEVHSLPWLISPPVPLPLQMTFTGSTVKLEYMGTYERSEKTAHGAPVFLKKAGDKTHYLFRFSDAVWMATHDEEDIDTGEGAIEASKASDLPSEAGLSWTYWDGEAEAMMDDPTMTCTAVRA